MSHDKSYCDAIKAILSRPDQRTLRTIRHEIDKVIDHVSECDVCNRRLEDAEVPAEVYELLGGLRELPDADRAEMDRLLEANASDEKAIGRAVVEALLPALPARLSDTFLALPLNEVQLFSALDAMRMLMHDWARTHDRVPDELTSKGEIRCEGQVVIPAYTVVTAVARLARIPSGVAREVVTWTVDAARTLPTLIPGVDSAVHGNSSVKVHLVLYSAQDDLFQRWSPRSQQSASSHEAAM